MDKNIHLELVKAKVLWKCFCRTTDLSSYPVSLPMSNSCSGVQKEDSWKSLDLYFHNTWFLFHPHSIIYIFGVNQWNCTHWQQKTLCNILVASISSSSTKGSSFNIFRFSFHAISPTNILIFQEWSWSAFSILFLSLLLSFVSSVICSLQG